MKYVLVTIFFLSLAFSVSKGMDDERESPTYFTLAMHWPISLCNDGQLCYKKFDRYLLSSFTVHGLWSYKANGKILENCHTTEALTNSKVNVIRDKLRSKWPDIYLARDKEFWTYQWKKHGSCSGKGVEEYFRFTLRLASLVQRSLGVAAQSALSDHSGHLRDVLYDKFNAKFQKNVQLKGYFRQGTPQLFEVHICFNANGIPIHCRERFDRCCGRFNFPIIYFPDANTLPNNYISRDDL